MILSSETFDPDAVFLDDIVDDEVLPYLSLAVDGLTEEKEGKAGKLELRPDDVAANDERRPIPRCRFRQSTRATWSKCMAGKRLGGKRSRATSASSTLPG